MRKRWALLLHDTARLGVDSCAAHSTITPQHPCCRVPAEDPASSCLLNETMHLTYAVLTWLPPRSGAGRQYGHTMNAHMVSFSVTPVNTALVPQCTVDRGEHKPDSVMLSTVSVLAATVDTVVLVVFFMIT